MFSTGSDTSLSSSPTPSTSPSTPNHSPSVAHLVTHKAGSAFLASLPVHKSSGDRLFLLSGTGIVKPILKEALNVVNDPDLTGWEKWESVKGDDAGSEVVYWRTKSDIASLAYAPHSSVDLDKVTFGFSRTTSEADLLNLATNASLRLLTSVSNCSSNLTLHIFERPPFVFPLLSQPSPTPNTTVNNPYGLPSSSEFQTLWNAWDLVTLGMIPPSMLHQKPIDLRHKPLFYIGHVPTFNGILLTKLLGEALPEPRRFATIFERGIDPHVDDPDYCHNHSEVPEKDEDWPALGEILAFRDRVRALVMRVLGELSSGKRVLTRRMARTMMMMLEHEGWHIETILYILIQRAGAGTLPPPGFAVPPWKVLAFQWDAIPPPKSPTVSLGPAAITIGHDDSEPSDLNPELEHDVVNHEFGWDNESPKRSVSVGRFSVEWRPITNGEFMTFWKKMEGKVGMPVSWVEENGEIKVRTLFGLIPMEYAKHWPCLTAYDDLLRYAQSKGGRIPTEFELRLFLDTYQVGYTEDANVGFRNWHPLPATAGGVANNGRGSNGGVWEWTSTLLDSHEGFNGTTIFPGYSSDFFDGKHQVVLGASYATIPRLAERRTVRNFYQHNYPYPWVAARVAYDN